MIARRNFLQGLMAVVGAVSTKSTEIVTKATTYVADKSLSLWQLIHRATKAKVADEIKLGFNQVDLESIERKASSDALGDFIINDMKQNPRKYLP